MGFPSGLQGTGSRPDYSEMRNPHRRPVAMTAKTIRQQLAAQDFFNGMNPDHLGFLADSAHQRQIGKEQVLFRSGEPANAFYLIVTGRISVEIAAISGPVLTIQTLTAEQLLGWSWIIPPYRWSFQARAEERTDLLEFDGVRVRERCEQDPAFGYEMLKRFAALMSDRLESARRTMMDEWNPPGFA
jgi:CRP-like cAMP-binding protein